MRLLWASNAPWAATGYGTQTKQVIERLLKEGEVDEGGVFQPKHHVAISANYGLQAAPQPWHEHPNVLVFPLGVDTYGNDVIVPHARMFNADWIVTLYDVWVYGSHFDNERIASWTPVDHYPVPPQVAAWCRKHPTIAMSQFGANALKQAGVERAAYAPHALDLNTWKPTDKLPNGQTAREAWNIPEDAFLVMVNAANKGNVPPRKSWGEMVTALAVFLDKHPDAYAYIHTELQGVHGGLSIPSLLASRGIQPERIRVPDQFAYLQGLIPQEALAAYYTSADVLLASSMGEGFGIPVIEAQACGTPVIVTDFSAQPELVGAGWKVKWQPYYDFTQGADLAMPSIPHIIAALDEAYDAKGDATLRDQALAKAAEYEADAVFDTYWRPILADLDDQLKPSTVTRQQRRAKRRKAA